MKTISSWKYILIGCLFLALLTACASIPTETPAPETTATTQPTIVPTASETPAPEPTFPIGTFEQVGGHWVVEFRENGIYFWYSKRNTSWNFEMKYV